MPFKNSIRFFLIVYVMISFFIFITIKKLEHGDILLFMLLMQVCASDIGGYIIGSFGKHYFSKISPHKTYEGLAGSMMFCIITGYAFKQLITQSLDVNFIYISFKSKYQ